MDLRRGPGARSLSRIDRFIYETLEPLSEAEVENSPAIVHYSYLLSIIITLLSHLWKNEKCLSEYTASVRRTARGGEGAATANHSLKLIYYKKITIHLVAPPAAARLPAMRLTYPPARGPRPAEPLLAAQSSLTRGQTDYTLSGCDSLSK